MLRTVTCAASTRQLRRLPTSWPNSCVRYPYKQSCEYTKHGSGWNDYLIHDAANCIPLFFRHDGFRSPRDLAALFCFAQKAASRSPALNDSGIIPLAR
jgi:hypothetical protein